MVLVAETVTPEGRGPENLEPASGARTVQKPVYYISEVLHEAKTRYLETHKLLYAIPVASRKLRHYFQAHRVVVVTSFPLRASTTQTPLATSPNGQQSSLSSRWISSPATLSRVRSWLTSS
jgi:hypothetical protein